MGVQVSTTVACGCGCGGSNRSPYFLRDFLHYSLHPVTLPRLVFVAFAMVHAAYFYHSTRGNGHGHGQIAMLETA
mgnify:CR=1 FL=1